MSSKKCILITAGPTRAYLDDVRYLSNYSTGELGFKICREFLAKGYQVCAVVGPTDLDFSSLPLLDCCLVETPEEMERAVMKMIRRHRPSWGIFSAAVLDFVPAVRAKGKTSSKIKAWNIRLIPTRKIIDEVAKKYPKLLRFGFKLEPTPKSAQAVKKFALDLMIKKDLAGLCVNYLPRIGSKRHEAYLFSPAGVSKKVTTKQEIAKTIVKLVSH